MKSIKLRVTENNVAPPTIIEGISPALSFEEVDGGIVMTSTDRNGTQTILIPQGPKGDKGDKGDIGSLTEEELEAIGNQATEALQEYISETYLTEDSAEELYALKNNTVITGSLSLGRADESAIGAASVAEGSAVIASGDGSHAEGVTTGAFAIGSHAEGTLTEASGNYSHAEGGHTKATGHYSHAEGYGVNTNTPGSTTKTRNGYRGDSYIPSAAGLYSHIEGHATHAAGWYDHAEGDMTYADSGEGYGAAHAEGSYSQALSRRSHAEGNRTITSADSAHAEGIETRSSGTAAHAEGANSEATGTYSHAEGHGTIASGLGTHAEGTFNYDRTIDDYGAPDWVSGGLYSVDDQVRQYNSIYRCIEANSDITFNSWKWETVKTSFAHVVGNARSQYVPRSNAYALDWEGNGMYMGDVYVHADGHSENGEKVATETYVGEQIQSAMEEKSEEDEDKFALKDNTVLTGSLSLDRAEGTRVGINSVAHGRSVSAIGNYSHAEGAYTEVTSQGYYSHAEGGHTKVSGAWAHVEGYGSEATGYATHASGWYTLANAYGMTAIGSCNIESNRYDAWVPGRPYPVGACVFNSRVNRNYGFECIEENADEEFDPSKWKIRSSTGDTLFAAGNGYFTTETVNDETVVNITRSNAAKLNTDGTGIFGGDLYVHADSQSENGQKVATEAYVQARIAEAVEQILSTLSASNNENAGGE